jgi:hypothetical protein
MDYDPQRIYSTKEERLNTILSPENSDMWRMISAARKDWNPVTTTGTFWDFLGREAGILVELDENGSIMLPATVIDQEKYLIFVLRYR